LKRQINNWVIGQNASPRSYSLGKYSIRVYAWVPVYF